MAGWRACTLAGIWALSTPAIAQTPPAATASATDGQDIIVTAQRRSERLQDVPVAVTVQTGKALESAGVVNLRELPNVTPGLRYSASINSLPSIRGVHSDQVDPGNDPNVSVYLDGVYQPDPQANSFDLPDIDRVEVLKGPQGTLFGRNATGGAIRIFTREPTFTTTGMFDVSYGRFNDIAIKGFVSTPLSDDVLAGSISGYYQRSDPYNRNLLVSSIDKGRENASVRGKLLFKPTDTFTAHLLLGYGRRYDNNLMAWTTAPSGNNFARLTPGALFPTKPHTYVANTDVPGRRSAPFLRSTQYSAALALEFETSAGTLSSTTAYNKTDSYSEAEGDFSNIDLFYYIIDLSSRSFSQELIFTSDQFGIAQVTGGGFFYHSRGNYDRLGLLGAGFGGAFNGAMKQVTDAYAGFGELTLTPADNLTLIAGARYSHEKRTAYGTYGGPVVPTVLPKFGERSFSSFTPRASIRYTFPGGDNVYFTYSRGFKSGGFNLSSIDPVAFDPEKLTSYEIGLKTAPSRPISANISAFYYDYTDQQVQSLINGTNVTANAGSSRIYGVDADIVVRPAQGLTLTSGVAYLHARFKRFRDAVFNVPTGPAGCRCGNEVAIGDLDGGVEPGSPTFTFSGTANYARDLGPNRLELSASIYHTSRVYLDNNARVSQKPYQLVSARASLGIGQTGLSVYAYGKNLTDENFIIAAFPGAPGDGVIYGEPRTYGVGLRYQF